MGEVAGCELRKREDEGKKVKQENAACLDCLDPLGLRVRSGCKEKLVPRAYRGLGVRLVQKAGKEL
jgi:hypothetical protein